MEERLIRLHASQHLSECSSVVGNSCSPFHLFLSECVCLEDIAAPSLFFLLERTGSSRTCYLRTVSAGFGGSCAGRRELGKT